MPNFNRVIIAGHATRDPALKHLPNNTAVCEFGLAVNRKWTDKSGGQKEEVCFVDCVAFGKPGETINQYVRKGGAILVEGRLKFDQWEDKQGGGKRSKHSIVVESFTFLGGKGEQQSEQAAPREPRTSRDDPRPPTGDEIPF